MTANNNQSQLQSLANLNMTTPYISLEQFVQYQLRQEEIERNRMRETMSNMMQMLLPGSNIDVNLMLPTSNPHSKPSILTAAATSVFQATTVSSSTRRPLPGGGKSGNKNNISKHIPWANILSLKCTEPTSEKALCGKEVVTEDELLRHQRFRHGILKYRCLNKGCSRSFDRR